ncbi:MAG: hypothetical protein WCC52_06765, partial [Nitrosotalea sp.]
MGNPTRKKEKKIARIIENSCGPTKAILMKNYESLISNPVIQNIIKYHTWFTMMHSTREQNKLAFVTCIEVVLMRRGNANYHLVMARLDSLYNCTVMDCYEHPEYLKTVLKEVYKED